jgi:hypothetical protein
VFTARYALSPYIKQIRFVFKGLVIFRFLFLPSLAICLFNFSIFVLLLFRFSFCFFPAVLPSFLLFSFPLFCCYFCTPTLSSYSRTKPISWRTVVTTSFSLPLQRRHLTVGAALWIRPSRTVTHHSAAETLPDVTATTKYGGFVPNSKCFHVYILRAQKHWLLYVYYRTQPTPYLS